MKALSFDVYGTLIDPAKIAEAVRNLTSAPAEFAATWRGKQIEYTFLLSPPGAVSDAFGRDCSGPTGRR